MKINVKDIEYNRFRDLDLNPINPDHVDVLADSITELGFFSGITVRPLRGGKYEAAAGHHRFEAARQAGIKMLEAVVQDYTDEQMVQIMVKENATQRGGNALATLDSVAATARVIAKQILLGEGEASRILEAFDNKNLASGKPSRTVLANAQEAIAKDGPGANLLFRAINGFDYEARKEAKAQGKVPTMSKTDIEVALSQLKESGYMAGLIAQIYAEVEAVRIEQRKAEEAERKRRDEEAERERLAAEKAQRDAELAAERAAEAKRKAQEAAKQADQEKARKAAEESKRRAAAAAEAEAERKRRQATADASAKAKAQADAREAERRERERKERLEIERQQKENRVYDLHAGQVFMRPSHQQAFRTHVTSQRGLIYIPKGQQLALAKQIKAEMERFEKNDEGSVEMGSSYIKNRVMEVIIAAEDAQRQVTDREAKLRLMTSDRARVDERWERIRRAMQTIESELMGLDKDLQGWQWGRETFPMNRAVIRVVAGIADRFNAMATKMGLKN